VEEWTPIDRHQVESLGFIVPDGPKLGTAYSIGIRDRAAVESYVDKLLEVLSTQGQFGADDVDTVEFQGHEVQELKLPVDGKLSWCFLDRSLVWSLYPTALRAALRLQGKPDEPTAADNPRFAAVLETFAGAPFVAINDTRSMFELLLSAMRMFAMNDPEQTDPPTAKDAPAESNRDRLPPVPGTELVARYFKGTVTTAVTKRAGSVQFVLSAR
jgi:hypothetical protein